MNRRKMAVIEKVIVETEARLGRIEEALYDLRQTTPKPEVAKFHECEYQDERESCYPTEIVSYGQTYVWVKHRRIYHKEGE